ncbi:MAG: small, acid-soluble spore protein, alpha/beta type [Bacillota bacterium]
MGTGSRSNKALVQQARPALDNFKYQVANQIGVTPPQDGYWGDLPSRQCGAVGGQMVRSMIQIAEQSLAGGGAGAVGATFTAPRTTGTTATTTTRR